MTMNDSLVLIYSLMIGAAVGIGVWYISTMMSGAQDQVRLMTMQGEVHTRSFFLRLLRPFARTAGILVSRMIARLEAKLGGKTEDSLLLTLRVRIAKLLVGAGRPEGLTPDEFIGLVVLAAIFGLLVGMILYAYTRAGLLPIALMIVCACYPVIQVRAMKRARERDLRRLLPYAIDLLSLSVLAGLDFTEALTRIVGKLEHASALTVELGETLRQIKLGKSRSDALRDLAHRVDLPELNSVVSALVQTDQLGGSLGPILRGQSEWLRTERFQYAEKLAMQAPVKILFPLILFIFPTIFIVIFGPIALKLLK
jgi:tight adherence protein C